MPATSNSDNNARGPIGKKPLVTASASFICGLLLSEAFSYFPLLTGLLILLIPSIELMFREGPRVPVSVFVIGGIGFMLPQLTAPLADPEQLSAYLNRPVRVRAEVAAPPQHAANRVMLPMRGDALLTHAGPTPVDGLFRLTLLTPETQLEYGDRVEMDLLLHRPEQFGNPGAFPVSDYLERQGFSGVMTLPDEGQIKKVGEGGNRFLKQIYRYREAIRQKMRADLSHDGVTSPILLAMLMGESGYLTDPIRDVFTDSGTNHILSISGSHLAMIALFVFGLSRFILLHLPAPALLRLSLVKIPTQWAALITAAVVTVYTLLSGSAVATQRSLVMILTYLLAIWIGRLNDIKIALALAALIILIPRPQTIFDISFQLSFLAVLFIVLVIEWWGATAPVKPIDPISATASEDLSLSLPLWRKLAPLGRPMTLLLLSSFGATLGTAPLTLYYFHQFSWIGFVSNLVIVPFAGWVIVPFGFISAVLSLFGAHFPLASWHDALGSFYFKITSFFANIPGADLHFTAPHLLLIVLFYLAFLILLARPVSRKGMGVAVALSFIVFLWPVRLPPKAVQVTFLDVGQGDAALVEFPEGATLLVDAGSGGPRDRGKSAVAPYLWEKKIHNLDYLVATHPQLDHVGGMPYIIRKFHVGAVLTNGMTSPFPFYQSFLDTIREKGIPSRAVRRADTIEIEGCLIDFLNPAEGEMYNENDPNNASVVFRLSCPAFGPVSFLLTGDIENEAIDALLERQEIWQSDILKVPHHGSRGSLNERFIKAVSPQVVVFSVGKRNRYGHPHPTVLDAYKRQGITVYRTDEDGAVTVTATPSGFTVKSFRETALHKVKWNRSVILQEIENVRNGLG